MTMATDGDDARISGILSGLASGSGKDAAIVREALFELAYQRMQVLARRMIRGFPSVRRWDDTADVVQSAAIRLHRALADVDLRDARHLLRLAALQIRRELIDLARKYSHPDSFAAQHETNSCSTAKDGLTKVERVAAEGPEAVDGDESWVRFHAAVAALPDDEREIFDLVWFIGAKQADVAATLGLSARTVRRRWETIRQRLVQSLGGHMPIK